ncbi:Metallo-dependent phosphatase-like protein [Lentinula aciculospora]|uniref:Metallo-dependent phosphatase-like protein n=1 Tax=Lentinula aciculospora TaxID=153920 RepID=A0A9W9AD56_9AGAR|nr:Metallo-dependent phosphatase-like protein [Lentinula aciculospora]
MAPPQNNHSRLSRIWVLLPILCTLYYIHLNGVHLQMYSLLQHAYTEHLAHLPAHKPFSGDVVVEEKSQVLLNSPDEINGLQSFTRHIVAVGDLHGDLPNALRVLRFSQVVDGDGNWAGNVDFFVQTGDIVDRGDDTIKLFKLMEKLREQAPTTGGVVLSNLGNHEWMNAIGDWRYVYPSEIKTFGTVEDRQRMISSGTIGRAWANNYTVATRLPLHPYLGPPNTPYPPIRSQLYSERDVDGTEQLETSFMHELDLENGPLSHAALSFVHGGLSPTYDALVPFPDKINDLGTSLLRKLQRREQPPPHPPYPYPGLPQSATAEEHELYDANGPLWYRGWALEPEEKVCKDVEKVLKMTGTRRMIMGHTPDFHNIVSRCNGKIIIIDTGISHAYGGVLSALSIHYTFTPIVDPENTGPKQRWLEREVVSALYEKHQEVITDEQKEVVGDFAT